MLGALLFADGAADVRIAVRRLRQRPGFAVAITVVAIRIGATTAVFSAIDATTASPSCRPNLATLPGIEIPFRVQRPPEVRQSLDTGQRRRNEDLFSDVGAYTAGGLNLVDPVNPQRVRVGVVTSTLFKVLGVASQLGRTFEDAEGQLGTARVALLSDAPWSRRYGRSDILDKRVKLSGTAYIVVGIMPPGFSFPSETDLWIPLTIPASFEGLAPFKDTPRQG